MKISVSTYSFLHLMNKGEMTQLDCVAKAKELGFDAVEFVDILPHDGSTPEVYAERLREAVEKEGLFISNYTFAADFLTGSGGDTQAEIERVKKQIDMAVRLGAKSVRHDATSGFAPGDRGYKGFENILNGLADACRQVTIYAEAVGVRTMVENHGYFCQESERVEKLINTVAHPNFGWLVDMGNFLCADDDPVIAVGRAAPYAFYVHAKDFHIKSGNSFNPGEGFFPTRGGNYLRGAIVGHGDVPVVQCLRALKLAGYDGSIAIEFEGMEHSLDGVRIGLANLKRFIEMV